MKKSVLVLNAGHEPIHRVTPGHAIRMHIRHGAAADFLEVDETETLRTIQSFQ